MTTSLLILESLAGNPTIYLNRHFPNRLSYTELNKLSLKRLEAFNKKYKRLRYSFKNDTYNYSSDDLCHNGYWGTDVEIEFNKYFTAVYKIIESRKTYSK